MGFPEDYLRKMYSDNREITDYTNNKYFRTDAEIIALIADKKDEVIGAFKGTNVLPLYENVYDWLPANFLSQFYDQVMTYVDTGYIVFFLDHPVHGIYYGIMLLESILDAFNVTDYKGNEPLIIPPKDLSRTEGSKSAGDMSLVFESERLSMKLEGAFEQYLSTTSVGIQLINVYKVFKSKMGFAGIV